MNEPSLPEESIFGRALEFESAKERAAYLDRTCGPDIALRCEVEALLRASQRSGDLLDLPERCAAETDETSFAERPGTVIGPYKLLEKIGEGGFGVVFLAEQTHPVRRKVALKILKPGMDTRHVVARFEAERQALALMDHPNIAKVLDGGATSSGRPYFVMELVKGVPINEFCDQNHLTPRQRLELFVSACAAVQHAHQKGVIHRDLKPFNVLVALYDDKPVPKVIDFGVAKAIGQQLTEQTLHTGFWAVVGTLEYMSPEQASFNQLDVDTRSDVYSLGILLYELLTGTTPLEHKRAREAGMMEALRIIREEEAPTLSNRLSTTAELASIAARRGLEPAKLTRQLRGELDWIVTKCLEKDRNRRYQTASGVAADVQRYLSDEPVQACSPSPAYRLRKFVRRHRGPVVAAALVLLALVGGAAGAAVGLVRARQAEAVAREQAAAADEARADEAAQRRVATEEATIARAVNDFLQDDLLRLADSHKQADRKVKPDPNVRVRTLLDRAAARVGKRFVDQPRVESAIRQAIGDAYKGLGVHDQAIAHLTRARDLRVQVLGPNHPDTLTTLNDLALAYRDAGRTNDAVRLLEQIRDGRTAVLGPDHQFTLATLDNLAGAYQEAGRLAEAIQLFELVRNRKTATLGPDHPGTLITLNNLGWAYQEADRTDDAIRLLEQVRDRRTAVLGPGHPETLVTLNNLATACEHAGRLAEAIRIYEQVREPMAAALGPDHPDTLATKHNLALAYQHAGRTAEAIRLHEQVRDRQIATLSSGHPDILNTLNSLAGAYQDAGRNAEAIRLYEHVRDQRTTALGPDNPHTLATVNNLAEAYRAAGRNAEAIRLLEQMRDRQTAALGPDHPNTLATLNNLAVSYWSVRQLDKSVPLFEETLRQRRAKLGDDHPKTVSTAFNLAVNYRDAGRLDEAVALFEDWLARSRAKLGPQHETTLYGLGELVEALARAKQFARAAKTCRELIDTQSPKLSADHPTRTGLLAKLGMLLLQAGRPAEAEPVLRECLDLREKKQPDDWKTFQTRSLLGGALLGLEKPAEAEPLLLQGYEGLKQRAAKIPASNKARVTEALERLVQLYDGWGKKDQATEWRQKLDEQRKP
jgi:serine/threonine protein kinase/tetratricopeptide (TPR) repeat protein